MWKKDRGPAVFLGVVIASALVLYALAELLDINLPNILGSSQLFASIVVVLVGFFLVDRFRDYSDRLSRHESRSEEVAREIKELEDKILKKQMKPVREQIDIALDEIQKQADENRWLTLLSEFDDRGESFVTLSGRIVSTLSWFLDEEVSAAHEILRSSFDGDASDKKDFKSASPFEVELACLLSVVLFGDYILCSRIISYYKKDFGGDPVFVSAAIRYFALSRNRAVAFDWWQYGSRRRRIATLCRKHRWLRLLLLARNRTAAEATLFSVVDSRYLRCSDLIFTHGEERFLVFEDVEPMFMESYLGYQDRTLLELTWIMALVCGGEVRRLSEFGEALLARSGVSPITIFALAHFMRSTGDEIDLLRYETCLVLSMSRTKIERALGELLKRQLREIKRDDARRKRALERLAKKQGEKT